MNIRKLIHSLLNKTERFLGTDTTYLARGTFWLNTGSVVGIFISFLLSVAYARYVPKETYGNYRYIISLMGMAGIFALPGMATVITRAAARGFDGTFRRANRIIFFSSFGISLTAIIIAIVFAVQNKPTLAISCVIAACAVPFVEGLGNWKGYLDGKKEFRKKTSLNTISKCFYGGGMFLAIITITFYKLSIFSATLLLITAFYITQAIANLFIVRKIMKHVPHNATEEPSAIKYGFHLSLATIPATIANYTDSVLLYPILGPTQVALYSFAIVIPEQLKALFINVATAAFPKLAAQNQDKKPYTSAKKLLSKKLMRASLFTGIVMVAYIVAAPLIYKMFFPRYIDATSYSQVFAISLILFPFSIFGNALQIEGDMRKIYIHNIGSPCLQIIVLAILIPLFGLWGAIWGRVIGRALNHFLALSLYKLGS